MVDKFKHISVADSRKMLAEDVAIFVDIRDITAYAAGHVKDAVRLDNASIPVFLQKNPKETPIIVYCYKGISSQQIADFLVGQGFEDVYSMDGGYDEWAATAQ
ncbi:thiosulfate sulfurtransferase GlpE [Alteromonas sp. a30]|uniref:thiosulfate sulfurtransferase GlpE n=1 Tax=Alteromonas sp. a30 TaxID=2730917 RepID=UPI002281E3F3|nr:thiosulfate sulfurtransferase GlpE [Alteromonas sp. a30]MCY7295746.1 thiosulfate sulfurtransferase GlpE [Alteromonas sp. a30]